MRSTEGSVDVAFSWLSSMVLDRLIAATVLPGAVRVIVPHDAQVLNAPTEAQQSAEA
jgi:hypothetical protein